METIEIYEVIEDMTILDNFQSVTVNGFPPSQVLEPLFFVVGNYPAGSEFVIIEEDNHNSGYVIVQRLLNNWDCFLLEKKQYAVKRQHLQLKSEAATHYIDYEYDYEYNGGGEYNFIDISFVAENESGTLCTLYACPEGETKWGVVFMVGNSSYWDVNNPVEGGAQIILKALKAFKILLESLPPGVDLECSSGFDDVHRRARVIKMLGFKSTGFVNGEEMFIYTR